MGGLYDILESYRDQQNRLNYEGLYEEPADTSINLDPMYNIGARQFGDMRMGMPQVQATGIMQQAPTQNFEFLSSAYEDKDDQQVDYLPGQEPSGIAQLLDYLPFGEKSLSGALLRNFLPQESSEIKNIKNFYRQNYGLDSIGRVDSGIMKGYNPVSGNDFLNKITGGFFPAKQFGLADAARRRINRIANRKIAQTDASRAKIKELQNFARADTISRARQANPGVYEGRSGGFDTSAADRAGTSAGSGQGFSNKSGRGRTGY